MLDGRAWFHLISNIVCRYISIVVKIRRDTLANIVMDPVTAGVAIICDACHCGASGTMLALRGNEIAETCRSIGHAGLVIISQVNTIYPVVVTPPFGVGGSFLPASHDHP